MEFKKQIIVKTATHDEEYNVAESIHNLLVGNPDYIESRVVLNMSADRKDGTENEVHVYIFPDAKTDIEFAVSDKAPAEKSNMLSWAEEEVEIACKLDAEEEDFNYACACYKSALKAFKCLLGEGHTGFSIGLTKCILNRLIDGKPLVSIDDIPDVWKEVSFGEKDSVKHYQCKRMSSLFKDVHSDGTVKYRDVDRAVGIDIVTNSSWHSGLAERIIDEMFPISLPYFPADNPYKVFCEEFLTDKKNGDLDTVGVLYIIKPGGIREEINRYFKNSA